MAKKTKKIKSFKAWSIITFEGNQIMNGDTQAMIYLTKKYAERENADMDESIIPVLITPIVSKSKKHY